MSPRRSLAKIEIQQIIHLLNRRAVEVIHNNRRMDSTRSFVSFGGLPKPSWPIGVIPPSLKVAVAKLQAAETRVFEDFPEERERIAASTDHALKRGGLPAGKRR